VSRTEPPWKTTHRSLSFNHAPAKSSGVSLFDLRFGCSLFWIFIELCFIQLRI